MVRIITDSAADFSPVELEQKNIVCIPLKVMFGEEEYQENIDLTKDLFYEKLLAFEGCPKTSQAAPAVLAGLIEEAKTAGDEVIYLTLSSALSGTWQSAMFIKEDMGYEKAFVVDSRNATGGQRMLVEYAVRLRDQGKCAADIVTEVEALRERIVLYACINTLEYLYRGGRISHMSYTLGTLAQIKPIIHVDDEGRLVNVGKCRGRKAAMEFIASKLGETGDDFDNSTVFVAHGDCPEDAAALEGILKEKYGVKEVITGYVGPVIGAHTGPGVLVVFFMGKNR